MHVLSALSPPVLRCFGWACALGLLLAVGCGTTREYNATQQLVMSDAVDRSVAAIDFRPLSGRKVYLDTSYLRHVKADTFVNAEYVTSALRQQIVGAGCLIQDAMPDAEVIIEARIGTLGSDDHRVTFGIPENNAFGQTVSLIPGTPSVPAIPEVALARREAREAAAKIAAFAYDRETRAPIWQSGVNSSQSTAKSTWVLGVGPFQGGSIREQTKLAGSGLRFGETSENGSPAQSYDRPPVDYTAETRFQEGWPVFQSGGQGTGMIDETGRAFVKSASPEAASLGAPVTTPNAATGTAEAATKSPDATPEIADAVQEPKNTQR